MVNLILLIPSGGSISRHRRIAKHLWAQVILTNISFGAFVFFFSSIFRWIRVHGEKNWAIFIHFCSDTDTCLMANASPCMWLKLPKSKSILHIKNRRTSLSFSSHRLFFFLSSSSFQPKIHRINKCFALAVVYRE